MDRLAAAKRTLQALQQHLTPQHPDVIRMTRMVHDLEEQIKAAGGSPDQVVPEETPETARDRKINDTQDQIAQIKDRIGRREKEEDRLRGVLRTYQARADAAPTRGTELIELTRDYGTLQDLYNGLLKKSEASRMAADLENRQIGEQFRLIDPARLPEQPISPNRGLIAAAGAAGGLALGLLLAALAEYRQDTFAIDHEVVSVLALPVLAMVPEMVTSGERRRRRARRLLMSTAGLAIVFVTAGTVVWLVLHT